MLPLTSRLVFHLSDAHVVRNLSNIVTGALRVLAVPPDALPAAPLTVVAQAQVLP